MPTGSSPPCRKTSWQSYSAGNGSKGRRDYDWAWINLADTSPDRWLLVRRNPTTGELAYYLAWSPTRHPLRTLVRVAAARWAVEETFQAGKGQVGLDHYQVRGWTAWHRHVTLCMLALAFLVSIAVTDTSVHTAAPPDVTGPRPFLPDPRLPIRLTVAEARHLIAALITEPVRDTTPHAALVDLATTSPILRTCPPLQNPRHRSVKCDCSSVA